MHEACFCGWVGELEDREPIYLGDGEYGLACQRCGHVDRLHYLGATARRTTLEEAWRRRDSRAQRLWQSGTSGAMSQRRDAAGERQ
jgi:hypothetical protein